jgi:hypothetical protein
VKLSPDLLENARGIISSPFWAFAPLALVLLATLILVSREFGWIGTTDKVGSAHYMQWPNPYSPVSIIGKTFRNEKVLLDGYSYSHCEFYNVTFIYNGTTPIQFSNNKVLGTQNYMSDNPAVSGTVGWLQGFSLLRPGINMELPPGSVVVPSERKDQ